MPSLTTVQIIIQSLKIHVPENVLLKPLLSITNVRDFEVLLPWGEARPARTVLAGELPFRIRRVGRFEDGFYVSEGRRACTHRSRGSLWIVCYHVVFFQNVRHRLEYAGYL